MQASPHDQAQGQSPSSGQAIISTTSQPTSNLTETFPHPPTQGTVHFATMISQPATASTGLVAGIASAPPHGGFMALHRHAQPELYHVTGGRGIVTVSGVEHEVGKGHVVIIPSMAEHGVRNEGSEELTWLYVFPGDGFGEVVYQWSANSKDDRTDDARRVQLRSLLNGGSMA